MTRKKFVKQLMALGYQRNEAQRLADYARRGFWTYEKYLEIEKRHRGLHRKFESFKISLLDNLTPAVKAAAKVVANLAKVITSAVSQSQSGKVQLDLLRDNMQVMARPEHDIMHGYACGIDLANGPDMTAYKPVMRLDSMVIDAGPVIPNMREKTATELAEEIMEKLPRHGGGDND